MENRLAVSFGRVADREKKHLGEEASGYHGRIGKGAIQASGQRVAQAFLGLFTVRGRLALRPGPIGALGLGRLAR